MGQRTKIVGGVAAGLAAAGMALGGAAMATTGGASNTTGGEHAANGGGPGTGWGQGLPRRGMEGRGMPNGDGVDPDYDRGVGGFGDPRERSGEAPLTGEAKDKAEAAALAKVPGASVLRSESNGDGSGYHLLLEKSDGGVAMVLLDAKFAVVEVLEMSAGGPFGGPGLDRQNGTGGTGAVPGNPNGGTGSFPSGSATQDTDKGATT